MDLALIGLVLPGVENHSIGVLAAAARAAGFETAIVPFGGWTDMDEALRRVSTLRPRVCGVSIQSTDAALASLCFTRLLRARGYGGRIVCGGHFATLNAEDIVRSPAGVDAVVRFAGEEALVGLLRAPDDEAMAALPGLVFRASDATVRRGGPARFVPSGVLTAPAREALPDHLGFPAADLVFSHGCEHRCAYCCVAGASSQARVEARQSGGDVDRAGYARRDVDGIADEMAALFHERGARVFHFMDDNVLPDGPDAAAAWARALRAGLDARGVGTLALSMQLRADAVSEASADALSDLGLVRAYLGIDAFSEPQLRALGRRADAGDGPAGLAHLHARGVLSVCNALLIAPTVRFDDLALEVDRLGCVRDAPVHLLAVDVRTGTAYYERAVRRGLVEGSFLWRSYRFEDPRTERVARVVTAMPSRLREHSVPIALYDLAYNLGIARRLAPEAELGRTMATWHRVAEAWNADQVRLLRRAIAVAEAGTDADVDALIEREGPAVRAHDDALLARCDAAMVEVERAVSRSRRKPVHAHARGRLLSAVAASMSLAGCYLSHELPPGDGGRSDAGRDAGHATMDARSDAPVCPLPRHVETTLPPCFPRCPAGAYSIVVTFDAQGVATDFRLPDGGEVPNDLVTCFADLLGSACYPSLAGTSRTIESVCFVA